MANPIRAHSDVMLKAVDEIKKAREQRDDILKGSVKVENKDMELKMLNSSLANNFKKIEIENSSIFNIIGGSGVTEKQIQSIPTVPVPTTKPAAKPAVVPKPAGIPKPVIKPLQQAIPIASAIARPVILSPELASQRFKRLSEKQKEGYIKELGIDYQQLHDFLAEERAKKERRKGEIKKEDYTLYTPKDEAVIANKYAKKYADDLIKKHPELFEPLFTQYKKVNMQYLSRSWVSMILFFSVVSFPAALILMLILKFMFGSVFTIGWGVVVLGVFLLPIATLIGLYFYPGSLIGDRAKKIKNELPFALIHMSAVAGSGAHPISIFELLLESNEYPELKTEIKKIMNYVNLFGYNLSTALRNTAATTPSQELKELLNGMVSTIETGGDLRGYLKGKADDMLNTYRLERKKEVEALGTYSEIYTSILIAAPLLLVVTLAIMNSITGSIAGMSISTVAYLGVGLGLPLLNIGFIVFLQMQTSNL